MSDEKPTCAADGCTKKLRADSKGDRCAKHRAGDNGPAKPKRKYTRKKNAAPKPKAGSKSNGSKWNDFKDAVRDGREALQRIEELAEDMGQVVPLDDIPELIAKGL